MSNNPIMQKIMDILENADNNKVVVIEKGQTCGQTIIASDMCEPIVSERSIKITNEPQPIPFVLKVPPPLVDLGGTYTKPKKPNTGFKLGSYTYKSKRK